MDPWGVRVQTLSLSLYVLLSLCLSPSLSLSLYVPLSLSLYPSLCPSMIVDDNASKDNERKRQIRDGCQFSVKMKKLPLRDCSQTVDSDVEVDSDVDSLASLQSLSLPKSGYSMLSIKNFLKNTKGARNRKTESVS